MKVRKGSIVSNTYRGGLWKVITREAPMSVFADCARYTIRNLKTGEFVLGCRDKDLITRDNPLFDRFVNLEA